MTDAASHAAELAAGDRFAFGVNWARFLEVLDERRIQEAETSLRTMLAVDTLAGLRFVDIGSGSGLFSLAARRLGAQVHSFDYDPQSVACTRRLRERNDPADPHWTVEQGSVLDAAFMDSFDCFDIVYSWGVLHHTGAMWQAIDHAAARVAPGGRLFIAIYNDQGRASRMWLRTKQAYNALPRPLRALVLWPTFLRLWGPTTLRDLFAGRPFATWRTFQRNRGMDPWRDVVDWVGGLPFEVAKPERIFDHLRDQGFELRRLVTCAGGHGCNEYVLQRRAVENA
ncbi:MAG: class I SAM-dependent methyltransferase, partial [Rubrivivax sp.]|nr:class I SAM-dependent methyltransferase [Rubrivivax sp.]